MGGADELERVLDVVHHTSADLKLASTMNAPETAGLARDEADALPVDRTDWGVARRRVLALLAGRDAALKLVLPSGAPRDELAEVLDDVQRLAPELPLILQPATPMGSVEAPTRAELDAAVAHALDRELRVRVIPQVHRFLELP